MRLCRDSAAADGCPTLNCMQKNIQNPWHFFVDRGGTFTDVIGLSPDGEFYKHKLLSENPEHYDDCLLYTSDAADES